MLCLITLFLLLSIKTVYCETSVNNTTGDYDPTEILEKIFNPTNITSQRAGYGLIQFEDQYTNNYNNFENEPYHDGSKPVKFEDTRTEEIPGENVIQFQQNPIKKKRRRRKPKQQIPRPQFDGAIPNYYLNFGQNLYTRPQRRPTSLASQALTSVTGALTSIARYDDYQCVPRLLCESASGGALGTSQILQSVTGLEPLLTLLSAYNGISTNPLFVFGRAVFLGMSSKGNSASCRYAYPQCPTDAEQLVHYLNNHNGGFFRFFNAPQQGQQNLEQFYNQLSQSYDPNQPPLDHNGINFGGQQNYGYQPQSLYSDASQGYGQFYPYNNYNRIKKTKINKIQKRIQNKPGATENNEDAAWKFPDSNKNIEDIQHLEDIYDIDQNFDIDNGVFKFPEDSTKIKENNYNARETRGFVFPEDNNLNYINNDNFLLHYSNLNYNNIHYNDKFIFGNKVNREREVNKGNYVNNNVNDGTQIVYVVRGNGDPNRPEIIKLKPGESIASIRK